MILKKHVPYSYIFSLIKYQLLGVVIIGGSISFLDEYFDDWGIKFPIFEMSIPAILGTTITLVLAFRIGQSYDRWWEARKVWGAIVNDSRALIREVSFLRSGEGKDSEAQQQFAKEIIRLLLGWNYGLATALRELPYDDFGKNYLSETERKELTAFDNNLPNATLHKMMQLVTRAYSQKIITDYQQIKLTQTLNQLGDSMGKSERIKNTVFPQMYSKMIDYAIWSFVVMLPLAFRDPNKYVEFPIVLLISMVYMMLEKIAKNLQNPFANKPTDTPLFSIVRNIEIFGLKILGEKDIPEKQKPNGYYIM